jgi:integrase
LHEAWIDTLRPPRLALPIRENKYVTLDDAITLTTLPIDPADLALRRDQAGAAMLFLSGMRVGALGSLPISAVDITGRTLKQWPGLGVRTKNSKTATTYLLNIPVLLTAVETWGDFIRPQLPASAMWFTPIEGHWGEQALSAQPPGANRAVAIGKRLRRLFAAAGLPFQSAHKFRHGHAVWALQHAQTMADYKAVSMNLMHSDIRITDSIYAPLLGSEVQSRIANLSNSSPGGARSEAGNELAGLSNADKAQLLRAMADDLTRLQP